MLASAQQVLAIFAVADTIKESSREAVADLHRLGVVSVMLTGDNARRRVTIARRPASTTPAATCSRGQAGGHRRFAALAMARPR
jgi:P-type E1-E2 ATPase